MGKKSKRRAKQAGASTTRQGSGNVGSAIALHAGLPAETEEMFMDDIGRCFCDKHRRAKCHECCFDFEIINRQAEIDAGLRAKPSELEVLTEDRFNLIRGIQYMRQQGCRCDQEEWLSQQERMLMDVEEKIRQLEVSGDENVSDVMARAQEKIQTQEAQRNAIMQAFAREHPGQKQLEWGGKETQRLYDQFASAPPTDERRIERFTCSYCQKTSTTKLPICPKCQRVAFCDATCQAAAWEAHKLECKPMVCDDDVDDFVCGYCQKTSSVKLDLCDRCQSVAYCDRTCQKAAWKDHRQKCKSKEDVKMPKSLPLTWKQVEAHGGRPVEGRVLEVRAIMDESMLRHIFTCKDRDGVVKRIAAYTNSRRIPGLVQGSIIRWKNPRFYYFMDGSSGARIEEEDLSDITVAN